jgi:hypothetical protein
MAEDHRRDLSILSGAERRISPEHDPVKVDVAVAVAAAAAATVVRPRRGHDARPLTPVERHPIAPHVGTLLIRVGTRLGGQSRFVS